MRSYAALCLVAKGVGGALRSAVALRLLRRILAPLLAAAAAAWLPPAAKEGQGDCDFPLGPPWILLYPLKRRRSARGLEAAERCVLAQRSAAGARGGCVALRSSVALLISRRVLAPLLAALAALRLPPCRPHTKAPPPSQTGKAAFHHYIAVSAEFLARAEHAPASALTRA